MQEKPEWIETHCARMDHGGCAIQVAVKDNRIVKIKGNPDGYLNKGYMCAKGLAGAKRLTHPNRLKYPLKRIGPRGRDQWQRISWTEAIGTIGANLNRVKNEDGPRSVAFCQGMPKGMEHFALIRLANIFGSPNVVAIQDVCHAPREISGMYTCGFYPVTNFHHPSKTVMLWGSNITDTNEEGEICSLLLNQAKDGTDLIVIDPRRTKLAQRAKYWLQLRPGSDNALALAFLNVIISEELYDKDFVADWTHGFDELATHVRRYTPEKMSTITWVPPGDIRRAARWYAASSPAAIQWGNPIEQNRNAFDTARALVSLMAICGNLDVAGGNIQPLDPKILSLGKFVRADLLPDKRREMIHAHHGTIPKLMTVPPAFFRQAVLEKTPYPVKAAYVQCANPLLAYADSRQTHEALMKLDFLAVSEVFMTPTAAMADIVLPAATHFEFNDIGHYGIGHGYILARPKVVEPPGECWPDIKILNALGRTITPGEYWPEAWQDLLESILKPSGMNFTEFCECGYLKGADRFRKYLENGFRTPTGKVELALSQAAKYNLPALPGYIALPEETDPAYPLVLTSSKDPLYLHSSYRWVETLRQKRPLPLAEIHPLTAEEFAINDGEEVEIETRSGKITQTARVTDSVHPQVVNAAYGWWFPEGEATRQYEWQRANFNILTATDTLGREFGTPNLKGIGCTIRPKRPLSRKSTPYG